MFSGFNGRLSAADPKLLAVDLQHSVDLKDPATSGFRDEASYVFSPGGREMAVPGENSGRLRIIDLPSMRIVDQFAITHGRWRPEATMLAWPTPNTIIATAQRYAAHNVLPAKLLVIDVRHRTVRQTPLSGTFLKSVALDRRRTVLFVAPTRRIGTARLVIVDSRGRMRSIALPGIAAGYENGNVNVDDEPDVLVRAHVAYVFGVDQRVLRVDLSTGVSEVHYVSGVPAAQPFGEAFMPGSGGIISSASTVATAAGPHRVLLGFGVMRPTADGRNQVYDRPGALVDTRSWQVVRLFYNGSGAWWHRGLLYVSTNLASKPEHWGPVELTAYDRNGRVVFSRQVRRATWQMSRGHLIEQRSPGGPYELDPLTGRPLHHIGTIAYPFDLIHWRIRH